MNYIQLLLFVIYSLSAFVSGSAIYHSLNLNNEKMINRAVYLGEVLLLGSTFIYFVMYTLGFFGFYKAGFLWAAILLNFIFLLSKEHVRNFKVFFSQPLKIDLPVLSLLIIVLIFIARNFFFLLDSDSATLYLYIQRLWLEYGTILWGNVTVDGRIFLPNFDSVPYALGLSIFPKETFFPELINLYWRLIVLLLVFGYISYRFNRWYALAGVMLVVFNDHFFYSGVNRYVVINAAIIAFLFAAVYNFWESQSQSSPWRLLLAIIFLFQTLSNKYQAVYILPLILSVGILIQKDCLVKFRKILKVRRWIIGICFFGLIAFLLYIKNWLVTGVPTFPGLAGQFGVLGWDPEMGRNFMKVQGGLNISQIIKYLNYLFIWPGIVPAKIVIVVVSFLPFISLIQIKRGSFDREVFQEWMYWLAMSLLLIIGICLGCHQDPRYYRFAIAVLAFSAVFSVDYIFKYCFRIKNIMLISLVLICISAFGYRIIFNSGGAMKYPSFRDNVNVMLDKTHLADHIDRFYPNVLKIEELFENNQERSKFWAWNTGIGGNVNYPMFYLPIRPQIDLWHTTTIKWKSYEDQGKIIEDLNSHGISEVLDIQEGKFQILSLEDFSQKASAYNRFPDRTLYDYGFPRELSQVKY